MAVEVGEGALLLLLSLLSARLSILKPKFLDDCVQSLLVGWCREAWVFDSDYGLSLECVRQ